MVYENIKELCSKKNLSIRRLEMKSELSNGTIGKWNRPNARPSADSLIRVAKALGVSVEKLMKE